MDDVDAYLASFPVGVQPFLQSVRAAILAGVPDARQSVRYKIAAFEISAEGAKPKRHVYFGGWKKHVGVYPVYPLEGALEAAVKPHRSGADTLKFSYDEPLPAALITRVVVALARR